MAIIQADQMAPVVQDGKDRKRPRDEELDIEGGYSAKEIFQDPQLSLIGYAYDDLICMPGHIKFGVQDVVLENQFTRTISLKTPIVSSPMDTVTESGMAIGLALLGGIGVIHSNLSLEGQVQEVKKVKKFEQGFIHDPICIRPEMTLSELAKLRQQSGFTSFPVTEDGRIGSRILGLVSKRDTDFIRDEANTKVENVMTQVKDLVTANEGVTLQEANKILTSSKQGKLFITKDGKLSALVARNDLHKNAEYPLATKDAHKRLRVAAAVAARVKDKQLRVKALVEVGVDAIVVDNRQGDNVEQHELIRWIKKEYPDMQVVGGNVATRRQAKSLIDCGVDALRVGMGIGSISTAQNERACGRAQATAVYQVSRLAAEHGVAVIADGGITSPGHMVKAFCLGASSVMCGSLLAGTEESPGIYEYAGSAGVRVKRHKGMGSSSISGVVQDKGSVYKYLPYLVQSIKHGLQDIGAHSTKAVHEMLSSETLRFELRSAAAQREGGIHGLHSFERKLFAS
eukprot:TRINITY_DN15771_c0_g1_i1.p1 TRINITY_DN15771_c0_g1~~TRINITY_DN15771_c0_g1_i1.p1  ORF type:complete len:513 (-),score=94.46 TRINITY_DN15771_c0_g1_i1:201-1739(-)